MKIVFKDKNQKIAIQERPTYKDIDLDLSRRQVTNTEVNKKNEANDVQTLSDIASIKNSLKTLFSTKKGSKLLNPRYGVSLHQYLFQPLSDVLLGMIGEEIRTSISRYEPRVTVINIDVTGNEDTGEIFVILNFQYNLIDQSIKFTISEGDIIFI